MTDSFAPSLIKTRGRLLPDSFTKRHSRSAGQAGQASIRAQKFSWKHYLTWLSLAGCLMGAEAVSTKAGLVVTAHPKASEAAAAMLRNGGNAMDAAVVAAYVLSVVEPYSAGIGGGGFLLYRDAKTKKTSVVDYREIAPKKAHRDMYIVDGKVDPKRSVEGIFAVGVPGMVPGLNEAQKRFGKKTLAQSLDAAIHIADTGFKVLPKFHRVSVYRRDLLRANPAAAKIFLQDGEVYPLGASIIQKDLADTLRKLKKEGAKLFTHGDIAKAMAKESQRLGGILTLSDLQEFKTRWREPLKTMYRGHEVITMPLPSSGGTHIIQMLNMLERDRKLRGRKSYWLQADDLHVLVESMRLAYADRATHLGDPDFYPVPMKMLLDASYLAQRYASIDHKKARPSSTVFAGAATPKEPNETTHLTIIDKEGNVVSLTQTINYSWGSGIVVPGTGVLLNNEMDDFSAAPGAPNSFGLVGGEANSVQPKKIPLSSMSPTIVTKDGAVRLAVGSPGGSTIITTVLQTILHVIDYGLDVQSAISSPRIHHQWRPDRLRVENGALTEALEKELRRRGHIIHHDDGHWGDATAIEVLTDGTRRGAADPRGDGVAVAE